jgi:hypothetical protein
LKAKDYIGFQNMIFEGCYCFDVECTSEIGELFQLDDSVINIVNEDSPINA